MSVANEITIRTAKSSDIGNLKLFFIKAYGDQTVFQNGNFLMYYFGSGNKNIPPLSANLIGINTKGEIISHYGGLFYNLSINGSVLSLIWGVNAFTIPEWRHKGVNQKIVNYLMENFEVNGVIGFNEKTALFYKSSGYNMFNFNRFIRYINIIDFENTKKIARYIHQDLDKICVLNSVKKFKVVRKLPVNVIKLTSENIKRYKLNIDEEISVVTTTERSIKFLNWRFLENPFINYFVYGYTDKNKIKAYIVLREEETVPYNYKIIRIIDLYGNMEGVTVLLNNAVREAVQKKYLYIDFSMFGKMYEKIFENTDFIKLENEDCCVLPQVTYPMQNRPNCEYIGMYSKKHNAKINNLLKDDVYFTRMDSDRDRINSINQIR